MEGKAGVMDLEERAVELESLLAALRQAIEEDASVEALHACASKLAAHAHATEYLLRMHVVQRSIAEHVKAILPGAFNY